MVSTGACAEGPLRHVPRCFPAIDATSGARAPHRHGRSPGGLLSCPSVDERGGHEVHGFVATTATDTTPTKSSLHRNAVSKEPSEERSLVDAQSLVSRRRGAAR